MNLSVYNGVRDQTGVTASLESIVLRISTGAKGLDATTLALRELAVKDPKKYTTEKCKLPAVTFGGIFVGRKHLDTHSGLVVLDVDGVAIEEVWDTFLESSHTLLMFRSPSGTGVKVVMQADPKPVSAEQHRHAWEAMCARFPQIEFDKSGKDMNRLCFLAHDPDLYINLDAEPVSYDPNPKRTQEIRSYDDLEVDPSALDFIDPDCEYALWLAIGAACYRAGVSFDVWDRWSAKGAKYNEREMAAKWNSFASYTGTPATWGTVVWHAKGGGYEPPTRSVSNKPVEPPPETEHLLRKPTELITARQLQDESFAAMDWLVEGFVPRGLTLLAGDAKIGKSYLAWNLALAVATGGKALSQIDITAPKSVLFLALEDPLPLLQDRLLALSPDEDLPDILHIGSEHPPLDMDGLRHLNDLVDQTGAKLVILDTFFHVKPEDTGSGNAYEKDYRALIPIHQYANEKGIGIILVHHTRKSSDDLNPYNKITGSMGMQAGVDAMLLLTKNADGHVLKVRGRQILEEEYAVHHHEGGLWELMGDVASHRLSEERKTILEILQEAGDEGLKHKEIIELSSASNSSTRVLIKKMLAAGQIVQPKARGKYYHPDCMVTEVTTGGNHGNHGNHEGETPRDTGDGHGYPLEVTAGNHGNLFAGGYVENPDYNPDDPYSERFIEVK